MVAVAIGPMVTVSTHGSFDHRQHTTVAEIRTTAQNGHASFPLLISHPATDVTRVKLLGRSNAETFDTLAMAIDGPFASAGPCSMARPYGISRTKTMATITTRRSVARVHSRFSEGSSSITKKTGAATKSP